MAMNSRRLAERLKRLKCQLAPTGPLPPIHIQYGEGNGEVTSTVTIVDGREEWWYAPGHQPDALEGSGIAGREQVQMPAGALR